MTLDSLLARVRQNVRDEADYLRETRYPEDLLSEIAEQAVPVYNAELIELLSSDFSLAYPENDPGADNVWAILTQSVAERTRAAADEEWRAIQGEEDDVA